MTTRVLFAGMDGAGKSTLSCSVYRWLVQAGYDAGLHEIDVWSDTHGPILGQKGWPERNKRGNEVRNYLADEFSAAIGQFVSDRRHDLVLGDLHGRWQMPDLEYWQKLRADGAVLVLRHPTEKDSRIACPQRPEDWEAFLARWDIPILFRVFSLQDGQSAPADDLPVTGLDRELRHDDPLIRRVAMRLIETTGLK